MVLLFRRMIRHIAVMAIAAIINFIMPIAGIAGEGMDAMSDGRFTSLQEVPDSIWMKLSETKIYFGHQSVGNNIIAGIRELMKQYPKIQLDIIETNEANALGKGVLAHSRIGENLKPETKIGEFLNSISNGLGKSADIVTMKFCYVDITKDRNIREMFEQYKNAIEQIKRDYPQLKIIHFTSPLTVSKTNWKTMIKKLLGKKNLWEYSDNIARNQFNMLIKRQYQDKDPVFDILQIESTRPDGSRQSFKFNQKTYYSLVADYTNDGGHLNESGRKLMAEKFLLLLANMN